MLRDASTLSSGFPSKFPLVRHRKSQTMSWLNIATNIALNAISLKKKSKQPLVPNDLTVDTIDEVEMTVNDDKRGNVSPDLPVDNLPVVPMDEGEMVFSDDENIPPVSQSLPQNVALIEPIEPSTISNEKSKQPLVLKDLTVDTIDEMEMAVTDDKRGNVSPVLPVDPLVPTDLPVVPMDVVEMVSDDENIPPVSQSLPQNVALIEPIEPSTISNEKSKRVEAFTTSDLDSIARVLPIEKSIGDDLEEIKMINGEQCLVYKPLGNRTFEVPIKKLLPFMHLEVKEGKLSRMEYKKAGK